MKTRGIKPILAALITLSLLGCGSSQVSPTHQIVPEDYIAPEDQALLIFVERRSGRGHHEFLVVDEHRNFVADLRGSMHTVVALPPGQHTFYVISEDCEPLIAAVEAGRTYIADIEPLADGRKVLVDLHAIRRGEPLFAEGPTWVRQTFHFEPDHRAGEAWVREDRDTIRRAVQIAMDHWQEASPEWRAQRTLRPTDGLLAEEVENILSAIVEGDEEVPVEVQEDL